MTTKDITQLIRSASKLLNEQNPFISTIDFNLYDSMSALDIMDPKMDGCEVPLTHYVSTTTLKDKMRVPPRPLPKSLDDDISPLIWDELNLSLTKKILGEMLIRLESFLSGNSIAETIYTCLYVHEDILQDMYCRLFHEASDITTTSSTSTTTSSNMTTAAQQSVFLASVVLVQLTDYILYIVQKADIYEEEDFTMKRFQFQFATRICPHGHDHAHETQDESMQKLNHWYDICIQSLQSSCHHNHDNQDVHDIQHILQYMFEFYMTCIQLSTLTKDNVATVSKDLYHRIITSSHLQSVMTSLEDETTRTTTTGTDSSDKIHSSCFDFYANRQRLGNTPIRKVVFRPYKDALQSLDTIYKELGTSVCHLLIRGTTLKQVQSILGKLSKSSSINIISRSLMVMNLYFDDLLLGQYNLALAIINDMKQFGVPSQVMQTVYGMQFIQQLCKPTYDALKLLILNRNRQMIFMDALILKEWSDLQSDATMVDATFQQEYDLGSNMEPFVMKYMVAKLTGFMEHYLALGVELKLYQSHHQIMTVYWYLDFLQSTVLSMTTSMKKQYEERRRMELKIMQEEADAAMVASVTTTAGKKGNKKKGKKIKNTTTTSKSSPSPLCITKTSNDLEDEFHLEYLNVKHMMYRGIFRVSITECFFPVSRCVEITLTFHRVFISHLHSFYAVLSKRVWFSHPHPLMNLLPMKSIFKNVLNPFTKFINHLHSDMMISYKDLITLPLMPNC